MTGAAPGPKVAGPLPWRTGRGLQQALAWHRVGAKRGRGGQPATERAVWGAGSRSGGLKCEQQGQ